MSNTILNQVYNHYLTTYAPKSSSYDAHKKSELRGIYNSIVKLNKESPLYLQDYSQETRDFAVSIKEDARNLAKTISSLGLNADHTFLNKRTAFSTNEDLVKATYLDDGKKNSPPKEIPSFTIKVDSLATHQVNLGAFLPEGEPPFEPGAYSFDVNINDMNYEFQFNIKKGESNSDIQNRLQNLINSADIGLKASVIGDNNARSALRISSISTGLANGKSSHFSISDENTSKQKGVVAYFGLNYTAIEPHNANFSINGEPMSSLSNQFTIDHDFEITLTGISQDENDISTIGLKTDLDSLTDNIHSFIDGYNSFLHSVHDSASTLSRGRKLLGDINGLAFAHKAYLDSIGIKSAENGSLSIDDSLLRQSLDESEIASSTEYLQQFASSLLRKSKQINLNPMNFVDKTVVAYKNPGKELATPYITSPYSGMLFNSYC